MESTKKCFFLEFFIQNHDMSIACQGFSAAFAVDGAGDDATGISRALAAGIEALKGDVVQQRGVTGNAQRRGGTGLDTYNDSVVGEEATGILTKDPETLAQAVSDKRRHPLVKA